METGLKVEKKRSREGSAIFHYVLHYRSLQIHIGLFDLKKSLILKIANLVTYPKAKWSQLLLPCINAFIE